MPIRTVMTSMVAFTSLVGAAWAQEGSPLPPREAATASLTAADVEAWLDGFMPYALQTADIAGAVVVVVKDGQVLVQFDAVSVRVFVKNVMDERAFTGGGTTVDGLNFPIRLDLIVLQPRTVGLSIDTKF